MSALRSTENSRRLQLGTQAANPLSSGIDGKLAGIQRRTRRVSEGYDGIKFLMNLITLKHIVGAKNVVTALKTSDTQ